MQSTVAFKKNILKFVVTSKNLSALRCLQYLSIVIFFEIISFAFVENYDGFVKRTKQITDDLPALKVPLSEDLQTLRTRIFFEWFASEEMDFLGRSFQIKYGHAYFLKYIVQFCGQLGPAAEKSTTGTNSKKRRKLQGAKGGDWQDVNATNILHVTVRLPGKGTSRCLCANFFIYSIVLGFENARGTETGNMHGE